MSPLFEIVPIIDKVARVLVLPTNTPKLPPVIEPPTLFVSVPPPAKSTPVLLVPVPAMLLLFVTVPVARYFT